LTAKNGQGASPSFRSNKGESERTRTACCKWAGRIQSFPNGSERTRTACYKWAGRIRSFPSGSERTRTACYKWAGRIRSFPNGSERTRTAVYFGFVGKCRVGVGGWRGTSQSFFIEGGSPGLGVCVPALARRYPSWELLAVGFYRCRGEGGTKSGCPKCSQDFNAMENCWHHLRDRLKNHTACWDRVQV
jgi:hypothetical protein